MSYTPPCTCTDTRGAVIGDFGDASSEAYAVAAMVADESPCYVATTGDNRYGTLTYQETVGDLYQDYVDDWRFFPALGNHDHSDGGFIQEYRDFFPGPQSDRYYKMRYGTVEMFFLDSFVSLVDPVRAAIERSWLQNCLAESKACHKLVFLHHSPYSSSTAHGSHPDLQLPFAAWGADAVLSGHDHSYERLEVDGIPYFVVGSSGTFLRPFGPALPETVIRDDTQHGALFYDASCHSLTFTYKQLDGTEFDTITI